MSDQENAQEEELNNVRPLSPTPPMERHEIHCPHIGSINVYVQGSRSFSEVPVLTVHDLGCDHLMYRDFVEHPHMKPIRDRTVWVHVNVPGQGQDAPDLPADYVYPTMQQIGEDIIHVLDQLKMKEVVCFGEGAGANILARFAMAHIERVLGVVLIHCTGTTAGFLESLKDKFGKAEDTEQLKTAIENYQSNLRTRTNPKNLKKFVEAFLKRTNIADNIRKLKCSVLLITGQKSVFNSTTHNLHQSIVKTCNDKSKVEFVEVGGIANVLEGKPEKVAESLQYFMQGLGLVSSVPMHHVSRPPRLRSLSMEEYDKPLRSRSISGGSNTASPLSTSPPRTNMDHVPVAN